MAEASSDMARRLTDEVVAAGVPDDVADKARYFGAGRGGYADGDRFVGVRVPVLRRIARSVRGQVTLADVEALLHSEWHEVRLLGAIVLADRYRTHPIEREATIDLLRREADRLDNWDLVDTVATHTLGRWVVERPDRAEVLDELIRAPSPWRRRLALVATSASIREGDHAHALRLVSQVLDDQRDLVQKAAGWMLREVGARDRDVLVAFLDDHAAAMPRTMLRAALAKHSFDERGRWLARP